MKHTNKECTQCGSIYSYYMSGHGIDWNLNDEHFCPDCMAIVRKALSKVKKEFVWKDVDASGDTNLTELLSAEKARRESNDLLLTRCYPGLFNMNGDSQSIRDVHVGNKIYTIATWEHDPEYSITKSIRWDVKNKKAVDGKEYSKPKKLVDKSKQVDYQQWAASRDGIDSFPVIPLTEPVGLAYVLRTMQKEATCIG